MGAETTILHTEASTGWGGQEIRIILESLEFAGRGYRMLIACPAEARISAKAAEAGLRVINLPMRGPFDPRAIKKFLSIIKSEKVDIIHTHSSKDSWLAGMAGRLAKTPVVRSRHLSTPVGKSWFTSFVYRSLPDRIITSGEAIKRMLVERNGIDPAKIVSVPAGVDTEKYNPQVSAAKVIKELGLAGAYPVVGCVAMLRSWKGQKDLFDAVPRIIKSYPEARFVIAGDGPKREEFLGQIRALGIERSVIMTGLRKDVEEIIAALDIFVLLSTASEATSQVIPQALSIGKAVVATDVGGLPEIIEDNVTGLLIPKGDPAAIADAIIKLADDKELAGRLARTGREKVLKDFTLKGMIDKTEGVYNRLLTPQRGV